MHTSAYLFVNLQGWLSLHELASQNGEVVIYGGSIWVDPLVVFCVCVRVLLCVYPKDTLRQNFTRYWFVEFTWGTRLPAKHYELAFWCLDFLNLSSFKTCVSDRILLVLSDILIGKIFLQCFQFSRWPKATVSCKPNHTWHHLHQWKIQQLAKRWRGMKAAGLLSSHPIRMRAHAESTEVHFELN